MGCVKLYKLQWFPFLGGFFWGGASDFVWTIGEQSYKYFLNDTCQDKTKTKKQTYK